MADFGSGFLSGFMQARQAKIAKQQQADQHQMMMLQMQEAKIKLGAMQQEEAWQAGRANAAKEGGLNGVIGYMESTRPEEGLKLKKASQDYQNSILEGEYRKKLTEGEDSQNRVKALTAAGNMYGQLNEIYGKDPELAQQAYEKNYDLIKQLDPGAPAKFDTGRAQMAVGLAVPQSQRYEAQQKALEAKSTEGKHVDDLIRYKEQGNQLGVEAITQAMEADKAKQLNAEREAQQLNLQILKDKQSRASSLREEYLKSVKEQAEMATNVAKMEALASSDDILTNPQKQISLINQYAKQNSPGIVTEFDSKDAQRSPLLAKLWQMKQSVLSGAPLSPEAVEGLISAVRTQWKGQQPFIENQDKYYTQLADKYGIPADEVINPLFKSTNEVVSHGEIIGSIRKAVPGFKEADFIKENIKANPGLDKYLEEHPEYKQTMLQKYYEQVAPKKGE